MKIFRWLLVVGVLAVIVAIIGGVFVYRSLGGMVAAAVNTVGPKVTGTAVHVESVSLSPLTGSGELHGLVVGNPDGFQTASAFALESLRFDLVVSSLMSDTIVIREILIDGPAITYEYADGRTNIGVIREHVAKFLPESDEGETPAQPAAEEPPSRPVRLDNFRLVGGQIGVSAAILGGRQLSLPLPDLEVKDLRTDSPEAMVGAIVEVILGSVFRAVENSSAWLEASKGKLEQARDMLNEAGDKIKGAASGLRNLFKKGGD